MLFVKAFIVSTTLLDIVKLSITRKGGKGRPERSFRITKPPGGTFSLNNYEYYKFGGVFTNSYMSSRKFPIRRKYSNLTL